MSLQDQEKIACIHSQYKDNAELIQRLHEKLFKDILLLHLSQKDMSYTQSYLEDRVNLFRFLKTSNFDLDKAASRLLETVQWRIELGIDDLCYQDCMDFYQTEGFAFFHGTDMLGRPLIFVRARYFPKKFVDHAKSITENIRPYACLMMEIARKLTWDLTRDREIIKEPIVTQMTVIADITKAPFIPVDVELIRTMSLILEERFPDFVSSINVLNFSWVYQGMWSVMKYLLNEEAKQSIRFTNIKELMPMVPPDRILEEMGGTDNYHWTLETDEMLHKYGSGQQKSPRTPSLSDQSRASSTSDSISVFSNRDHNDQDDTESELFFDATDNLSFVQTPSSEKSLIIPPALSIQQDHFTKPQQHQTLSWAGLRTGVQFLTSFMDSKPPHEMLPSIPKEELSSPPRRSSSVIIVNPDIAPAPTVHQQHILESSMIETHFQRITAFMNQLTHQFIQLSLGPRSGMFYWILVYVFSRGPVENMVRRVLEHSSWITEPQKISRATIGVTAAVAALVSNSLSSTLERIRNLE
ncbi:hypothetical protein CU098_010047 [Rhizopus stolonifer]|uniref:CRAL-TRIO domain-containing protein n=1 Tax=Rhizopus stolonifer TaxID=4846 RepID=A0A367KNE9_RHIST|nr:hypothetical protein CU098_010047 [Rhizopus stolonifer]